MKNFVELNNVFFSSFIFLLNADGNSKFCKRIVNIHFIVINVTNIVIIFV